MTILDWQKLTRDEQRTALERPAFGDDASLMETVGAIVYAVKERGDEALRAYCLKFDGAVPETFRVAEGGRAALDACDPALKASMERAKANILKFHEAERPSPLRMETSPGVTCELQWLSLDSVGLYIPGGTAPLLSTVLMLALPATLAGCRRIILCTPAPHGTINPVVLAAAALCGIKEIYAMGGAQAIAAMAYGTNTIPKVDKIFGPGNAYVTFAKQMVSQDPDGAAIDMPAGPSEVMVLADEGGRAPWIAADLLAQAEHDVIAHAVLVTTSAELAHKVEIEIKRQLPFLSRSGIAEKSLQHSRMIVAPTLAVAIEIANAYAPEHLILHCAESADLVPSIRNAGSVFVGSFTPEAAGDYASGTNHVLPTYGYARSYNGVTLTSFMKSMTVQKISEAGLRDLGPAIITMALAEGLDAHAKAVQIRLEVQK